MSVNRVFSCDRCGATESCDTNHAGLPEGWGQWAHDTGDVILSCPACKTQVDLIITRKMIHVGHARQSGSGKSWTELGLDRQSDPERWFEVYCFRAGNGLPSDIEDDLRAELEKVTAERDRIRRELQGIRSAAATARQKLAAGR